MVDEIVIDEKTKDNLLKLTENIMSFRNQIQMICQTLYNYNNLEGDFALLADCTKMVRVPAKPEQTHRHDIPEGGEK